MLELTENVGNNTGDFLKDMANNVGDVVCGLYKDYAGNFLGDSLLPTTAFLKGTWDSLCAPRPSGLPPSPTPPFQGGQCCDVAYKVFMTFVFGSNTQQLDTTQLGTVNGIDSYREGSSTAFDLKSTRCDGSVLTKRIAATGEANASITITGVQRQDGLPDLCGDPPTTQPMVPIPPDKLTPNVPYTYNDGTDVAIPIVIAPIRPTGIVNIDVGGLTFKFDAGGVDIELPDEEEEKKDVVWVVVELTTLPDKTMFGTPNVYFAGWITFSIEGDYTTREQINFERSVFRYPDRATSHHITFTNKASGVSTTYTTQE